MSIMKQMGGKIAQRRKQLKMSQRALARAVGIKPATMCRIEAGDSTTTRTLEAIARELHISFRDLFSDEPLPPPPIHPKLAKLLAALDSRRQASLLDLLERGTLVPSQAAA